LKLAYQRRIDRLLIRVLLLRQLRGLLVGLQLLLS
jgi:hypothetical protein